jgi:hypothetical protein
MMRLCRQQKKICQILKRVSFVADINFFYIFRKFNFLRNDVDNASQASVKLAGVGTFNY